MSAREKLAFLLILLISASCVASSQLPSAEASPAKLFTFDVASIHVNSTATDGRHHIYNNPRVSQFRAVNVPAKELIQFAYDLPSAQILGGPDWIDSTTFDINAQSDSAVDAQLQAMTSQDARRAKQRMVQALLTDRYQLKSHQETRQLPVYALVVANPKAGPRFQPSQVGGTTINSNRSSLHIAGSDNTIALLTETLSRILGRVVLNRTGLTGRYDLTLRWTPDDATSPAGGTPDGNAPPSIFTTMEEQLGLKLESAKGPVTVLIVDSMERPTGN